MAGGPYGLYASPSRPCQPIPRQHQRQQRRPDLRLFHWYGAASIARQRAASAELTPAVPGLALSSPLTKQQVLLQERLFGTPRKVTSESPADKFAAAKGARIGWWRASMTLFVLKVSLSVTELLVDIRASSADSCNTPVRWRAARAAIREAPKGWGGGDCPSFGCLMKTIGILGNPDLSTAV
jgi:hypothetical protein